ncbi:MAG: DNA primase [Bacillaceae bacterium]|nr:DNA primase [Bacillaceae bacterium]
MTGPIPEEIIDRVRSHFDILDIVGQYVQLRKSGRYYFGLCPFHSEKTPSFSVSPDKQIFHCFGCGEGGNVISFLMKVEGLHFVEAVEYLAERAGIDIPERGQPRENQQHKEEKNTMYKAHDLVAKLYHHILLHKEAGKIGLDYLKQRGFTGETIEEFQLGYAPDSWYLVTQFLQKRNLPLPLMEEAGLVALREAGKRYFDRFRGRVMFPIHDTQGRVVAFGGRAVGDQQPKYLNSPETRLFNKGRLLFNLHRARNMIRREREAVLFEGYADVISAWQGGIHNCIASLGTALTEEQARVIRRNAEQVIICYDSDRAGVEAALKSMEILTKTGCHVKIARLPEGMDPDDYIRRHGGERFRQDILLQAQSATAFQLDYLKTGKDLQDETERMNYIHEALEVIARLSSAVERDHYLRRLAEEFDISFQAIRQEHQKNYRKQKRDSSRDNWTSKWNNNINNGNHSASQSLLPAHHKAERMLIVWMMRNQDIAARVEAEVGGEFSVDEHAALAAFLYKYYREGNEPDPGKFVNRLDDERLMKLASELAMLDINEEVSEQELTDYIQQVLNYPKWLHIEQLKKEQRRLEKMGNSREAAEIGVEIFRLQRQLKARPNSQGRRETDG